MQPQSAAFPPPHPAMFTCSPHGSRCASGGFEPSGRPRHYVSRHSGSNPEPAPTNRRKSPTLRRAKAGEAAATADGVIAEAHADSLAIRHAAPIRRGPPPQDVTILSGGLDGDPQGRPYPERSASASCRRPLGLLFLATRSALASELEPSL